MMNFWPLHERLRGHRLPLLAVQCSVRILPAGAPSADAHTVRPHNAGEPLDSANKPFLFIKLAFVGIS